MKTSRPLLRAILCAAGYAALLPFTLLALRMGEQAFVAVVSVLYGAALLVGMFAALADMRVLPRLGSV